MSQDELPICTACGSQFDLEAGTIPKHCKICDDPRQFVPPSGQSWTNLSQLRREHENKWQQDPKDPRIWSIYTEPKFAIGQRAILLQTDTGNVLWDMIALLDENTVNFVQSQFQSPPPQNLILSNPQINSKGNLKAIVISHPHYYTTYIEWAQTFNCPIYISANDKKWLCQKPPNPQIINFIEGPAGTSTVVLPGITAIKTGGHFDGSLVLYWERKLFIADTVVTVPSAYSPPPRPPGQTSYSFQWSIPNMIPLPPDEILKMWRAIKPFEFDATHGAFVGMDVRDGGLKGRMLESMQIQVRGEGWGGHEILGEVLDT